MSDLHLLHEWGEWVIPGPGIGRYFAHHLIRVGQMVRCPRREALQAHLTRGEHHLLRRIDRRDHDVVFVDVQREKTLDDSHGSSSCTGWQANDREDKPEGLECVVVSCWWTNTDTS